jgi:tol-pal system protein YbgF
VSPLALSWRTALAACLLILATAPGVALAQDSDAARIKKLEAEVANLKVMVGTLESLVRTSPRPAATPETGIVQAAPSQDDLGPRVSALETQIGALTNQIEQLGQKMSALETKVAAAPAPVATEDLSDKVEALERKMSALQTKVAAEDLSDKVEALERKMSALETKLDAASKAEPSAPAPQAEAPKDVTPEEEPAAVPAARPTIMPEPAKPEAAKPETAASEPAPVMSQTVVPAPAEQFDPTKPRWYGPHPGEEPGEAAGPQSISPPGATGSVQQNLPQSFAALPDENAQALYDQGYGDILQRDYPAAAKSFAKLVSAYPNDPLAGSAQYWVGESYYVRKEYKKAADSFLTGYRKYSGSEKAPDTLLRLGMSLAALGQKDAACSTFQELKDKFPDAPANIQDQAKGEAGKAGC